MEQSNTTGQNFALFDRVGLLVDWSAGFCEEFAAAKALIAPGASLRALLTLAHAGDAAGRADMATGSQFDLTADWTDAQAVERAALRVFDYRTSAGQTFRVTEDRAGSGGLVRMSE
jgi:hypothetical protein